MASNWRLGLWYRARMGNPIPFHRPSITQSELDAVAGVLRSGWLTTGPKVKELEGAVAAYVRPGAASPGAAASPARPPPTIGGAFDEALDGRLVISGKCRAINFKSSSER